MAIDVERVIFRVEKNPYVQSICCTNRKSGAPMEETLCNPEYYFLAVFPDDPANPDRVPTVRFYFDGHGVAHFEPYEEIALEYYYKTKILHKKDPRIALLLKAVTDYYSTDCHAKFRVVEKLTH